MVNYIFSTKMYCTIQCWCFWSPTRRGWSSTWRSSSCTAPATGVYNLEHWTGPNCPFSSWDECGCDLTPTWYSVTIRQQPAAAAGRLENLLKPLLLLYFSRHRTMESRQQLLSRSISHLFLTINSSINFLVYCSVGDKFQKIFCRFFSKVLTETSGENIWKVTSKDFYSIEKKSIKVRTF